MSEQKPDKLKPDVLKRLYKTHQQGAIVRSGANSFMAMAVLSAYLFDTIEYTAFVGFSFSAAFLVLMNLPILWIVKFISRRSTYEVFSLGVNVFEIIGYTGMVYFAGGVRGTYLILCYPSLITYVGITAPSRYPFIIAGICALAFSGMAILEHMGILPHQNLLIPYHYSLANIILIIVIITASLYVVAFISAFTSLLLKKNRNRLKRQNEELERSRLLLSKSAEQLKEKNYQLQISERLKSEFLANMSHEIRTPMNGVIGFTDMLLETTLSDTQLDYTKTIQRCGLSLLTLINDILDLSKIEAGELLFEEKDFDPELIAYDVCDMIRPLLGNNPVEIICHIGDEVPSYVKGDPLRFRQVLINLMANASKFVESGEIELSFDAETETDEKMLFHIKVRDTGIGISGDKLESIFQAFQQADGSTTRQYGGSGLGLSICKRISRIMNGDVWAVSPVPVDEFKDESKSDLEETSKKETGSVFHFTGWFKKSDKKRSPRITAVPLKGKRVLIIDDNRTNLNILTHMLEYHGMIVTALEKGDQVPKFLKEALDRDKPYDICVSDIQMPFLSGYEVARQIRSMSPPLSNIPMIALSSVSDKGVGESEKAGFNGFMTKPIRRVKLYRMMARLLGTLYSDDEKQEEDAESKILTHHILGEDLKRSVKILLVEDNKVNQKLALVMLEKAGYEAVLAENGLQAVDEFSKSPSDYDLILMDVQMPVMDGLQATKEMRKLGFDDIPIIAMTASAMKGDREKCLDAGMNEYIQKPIRREHVYEILYKWVFKKDDTLSGKSNS